jgi:parallel beta-helix repeat protein
LSQSFYGGNIITNFTYGIYFEEVNNAAIITRNTLANNTVGLLLNNSNGNTIYHNNFISNSQQVMTVGTSRNIWNKNSDSNYWSDYTGLDEDQDGKGDSPYIIDEQNQDNYPFMKK